MMSLISCEAIAAILELDLIGAWLKLWALDTLAERGGAATCKFAGIEAFLEFLAKFSEDLFLFSP